MFGIRYFKASPTTFVLQYVNGRVKREGTGLSFFYFAPTSTLVAVPVGSTDVPFIFNETTADFQAVTVQGHLTFRVADPRRLAALLDYSVAARRQSQRRTTPTSCRCGSPTRPRTPMRAEIQSRPLRAALVEADAIAGACRTVLAASPTLAALGVELLGFSILAIKPVPETSKALEAEARERLLREADDAHLLPAQQRRRAGAHDPRERTEHGSGRADEAARDRGNAAGRPDRAGGAAAATGADRGREQQDAGRRPGLRRRGDAEAAGGARPEVAASAGGPVGRSAAAGGDGVPGHRRQRRQGRQPEHLAGLAGDVAAARTARMN